MALLAVPAAAAAQAVPAVSVQDQLAQMSDLDIATAFFFPRRPFDSFLRDACTTNYRTRLKTIPEEIELEREIPGIHDVMIRHMDDYCLIHLPPVTDTLANKVRDRVGAEFTPAEIKRIVENFRFSVEEIMSIKIDVREGERSVTAVERGLAEAKSDRERFARTQAALARAPGGTALLGKIGAFQTSLGASIKADIMPALNPVIAGALNNARKAGNAFAVSKGHDPVYIVD